MDERTAKQLGRHDRNADRPNSSFANRALSAECCSARVGTKTHLLEAYNRGWHEKNHRRAQQELARAGYYAAATTSGMGVRRIRR